MNIIKNRIMQSMAGIVMAVAVTAGAQTPATPAPAAAPAPAAPVWSLGSVDFSGFIDGYYSYNANNPSQTTNAGQFNQLYNFNDATNQFALSAAKLTINHDADPVGAHVDLLFGRSNNQVNGSGDSVYNSLYDSGAGQYIEQAFVSFKPTKAKGFEADFGKFVTSAGAEVIESKDNWNYSRSLLFAHAIPYDHFGLRTSIPVTKAETFGVQVVNGFSNYKQNNGVTIGVTSAYVKTKYTWNANYYTGSQNVGTQKGHLNLFDTTLLLTPNAKFNAYINYDYGQNRDAVYTYINGNTTYTNGDKLLNHWQGVAFAARQQVSAKDAFAGRYEFYYDPQSYTTPIGYSNVTSKYGQTKRQFQEFTFTYEHKWVEGLLARVEYRNDWSNFKYFTSGNKDLSVKSQSTLTAGFVAFFGPKR